jgi:hypothetical protein
MPNRPLRTCPTCSGSGHPSYVRSGDWLNRWCPGKNGPVDADDYPQGHELDCTNRRGLARVEYKRRGELMLPGQAFHFRALHACVGNEWLWLFLVVMDEGQTGPEAQVRFRWLSSRQPWADPATWPEHRTTLDALGRGIALWMWERGPAPLFATPPPPACAACAAALPATPTQTMPYGGRDAWVCLRCFREHFGVKVAA